jgi:hypothetical protein
MFLVQLLFLVCTAEVGCGAQVHCPAACICNTTEATCVDSSLAVSSRKECSLAAY